MNLALAQAKSVLGNTKNNPAVGCVIVKSNCVIHSGSTGFNGRPHAEYNVLNSAKKNVNNSSLYVTLEPCSHYGKTPPCVNIIIKKKIKKVFFSVNDPDIRSYNKCIKKLKRNKILAKKGPLSAEIKSFYRSYYNYKKDHLPFVTAKLAVSKDLYSKSKKYKWITNKFSRGRVHLMRSTHDCLLTSIKTVSEDNPLLNCRIQGLESYSPTRIILDKKLRISFVSRIVKSANKVRTIIFYNQDNKEKIKRLKKLKIKLIKTSTDAKGDFNLKEILIKIKSLGYSRIFLETGLNLCTSFLNKGLINDFQLFVSNQKLGSNGINSFKKNMNLFLKDSEFLNVKVNLFGDRLLSYRIK